MADAGKKIKIQLPSAVDLQKQVTTSHHPTSVSELIYFLGGSTQGGKREPEGFTLSFKDRFYDFLYLCQVVIKSEKEGMESMN